MSSFCASSASSLCRQKLGLCVDFPRLGQNICHANPSINANSELAFLSKWMQISNFPKMSSYCFKVTEHILSQNQMNAVKFTTVEVKNRSILLEKIRWITEHTLTTTLQTTFLEQSRGEIKTAVHKVLMWGWSQKYRQRKRSWTYSLWLSPTDMESVTTSMKLTSSTTQTRATSVT